MTCIFTSLCQINIFHAVSTEQYCSREACHIQPLKLDKEKNSHHGLRKR